MIGKHEKQYCDGLIKIIIVKTDNTFFYDNVSTF